MSKRMVKNAWERSYRCNKVFKPVFSDLRWMWRCIKAGLVRFAAAVRFFSPRLRLCVFFSRRANKKGLHWCLFLLYQATTTLNRVFLLEHTATISPNPRWKYCAFTHFPLFCVAGLQQMPPQRIPHYYPAAQTTEKIRSPQRFSRTFPRIPPFSASRIFTYVRSIQRQNVRNNSINGRA